MPDTPFHILSILFAIITGTGAGLLVLLSRNILRESPFRKAVLSLLSVMWLLTLYHTLLLVVESETMILRILQLSSLMLVIVSLSFVLMADREISNQSCNDTQPAMIYPRRLLLGISGLFLITIGGPLFDLLLPVFHHWVHGFAALLIFYGLYDPVHRNLQKGEWTDALLVDPTIIREPDTWMRPMDDTILEVFHSSGLVLTPAIIAVNIDCSREEVNRRLSMLESNDLVEKVERGKYQITYVGKEYLQGGSLT